MPQTAFSQTTTSQVANDDLCLNLEAAYDLSPAEYDEVGIIMERFRDCPQADHVCVCACVCGFFS